MVGQKPNVLLIITDDQGYGDLSCTGNPWLRTPNIDQLNSESACLTDFHVSPLCTPTRAAIMTGRNPLRTGAWATARGRAFLNSDETTLAEVFRDNGYDTGMFGKWHLGDNYPYRPFDRGFNTVVAHKGGGIGQIPDFWGNSYFDDTYFHNGAPKNHSGYCTNIWFDEAISFISQRKDRPFFCYLATNAPHAPYLVDERYSLPYVENKQIPHPDFYGMIANIDENVGKIDDFLTKSGLKENTILIFMTDNGTSGGWDPKTGRGYNAGMRGKKKSYYDGGHRVPFFIRWPNGAIRHGRNIDELCTHTDIFPTILDLCGLSWVSDLALDGVSLAPLLEGRLDTLEERKIFVQFRQSSEPPLKWENAVLKSEWRLVHGDELYNIKTDPSQLYNISAQRPEVVHELRNAHETWWEEVTPELKKVCAISIGAEQENPTRLDAMDLMGDFVWKQSQVKEALKCGGFWNILVEQDATYKFTLKRWPAEVDRAISEPWDSDSVIINAAKARLRIGMFDSTLPVTDGDEGATFIVDLKKGSEKLSARLYDDNGDEWGAYYVYAEKINN